MGELVGASPDLAYGERKKKLLAAGIALWDVIDHCEREGSLDSAINQETLIPNDFEAFFKQSSNIKLIAFNGQSVKKLFDKHVAKSQVIPEGIELIVLPSTSPAYAGMTFQDKLQAWKAALEEGASH